MLYHWWDRRHWLCQVRIFIYNNYNAILLRQSSQFIKCSIIAAEYRSLFIIRWWAFVHHYWFWKCFQILFSCCFQCGKKYRRFVLTKFIYKRSLSYAPSPINYYTFKTAVFVTAIHFFQFLCTAVKLTHCFFSHITTLKLVTHDIVTHKLVIYITFYLIFFMSSIIFFKFSAFDM